LVAKVLPINAYKSRNFEKVMNAKASGRENAPKGDGYHGFVESLVKKDLDIKKCSERFRFVRLEENIVRKGPGYHGLGEAER
jgi:hypothetical protein